MAYLGDAMSGAEAARWGWANRAVPADRLSETVDWFGRRLALLDREQLMYNKRAVDRAYEVMGIRTALNAGADIQALSAMRPLGGVFGRIAQKYGLKETLAWRDGPFGDSRTKGNAAPRKDYPDTSLKAGPVCLAGIDRSACTGHPTHLVPIAFVTTAPQQLRPAHSVDAAVTQSSLYTSSLPGAVAGRLGVRWPHGDQFHQYPLGRRGHYLPWRRPRADARG
ncbi:MAG: hypothetical protein ACR2PL_06960 [Dehalococcoidia bacterium]